jgi:trk system potassium uptake protein TrkA
MKTIAVVGLGEFGIQVAVELSQKGFYVIGIDNQESAIDDVKDRVNQAVILDSTDESAMRAVNVDNVDVAVVSIGSNVQSSLLTAALLKKFDIKNIYVRSIDELQESILESMKIKNIINIAKEMGKQLSRSISSETVKYIEISNRHSIVEMHVPSQFVGKSLAELKLRRRFAINVIGIKTRKIEVDDDGDVSFIEDMADIPDPTYTIQKDDILIVLGTNEKIEALLELGADA